ncbi:MAG: phage tail protein [Halieaceae bacterium]|jgi:hypothetical protein|nr:phage tail protein [Halieaceae bacterium]
MTDLRDRRRDALFELLPAVYRQHDDAQRASDEQAGPLRALLGVLAGEAGAVEDDILGLLDNWFIETCDEWVVPYIADLLGVRGLQDIAAPGFSRRALVANTLSLRRAKGTPRVLEQLAQDATGWRALAREEFPALNGTQNVNHLRRTAFNTPDIRDSSRFLDPRGPFDTNCHLVDVRSVELARGRFNIPNISIFLWRLQSYLLSDAELSAEPGISGGWRIGAVAGADTPLFNVPRSDAGTQDRTSLRSVPAPLSRRLLHDELEARRRALAGGRPLPRHWFDEQASAAADPVFCLSLDGVEVAAERILICDLSSWRTPPDSIVYELPQPDGSTLSESLPIAAAIDPELGRLRLAPAVADAVPRLTHSYGFPGDLGAGPFSRRAYLEAPLAEREISFAAGVSRRPQTPSAGIFGSLGDAIAEWNAQPAGSVGLIVVMDNGRYEEDLSGAQSVRIPEGSRLWIVAADWPAVQDPAAAPGVLLRAPGQIEASGLRPRLAGAISVEGSAAVASETPGELLIDGLAIDGAITIAAGNLGRLALSHSTVAPTGPGIAVAGDNDALEIELHRCISGAIGIPGAIAALRITDSIIDGNGATAIDAPSTPLSLCAGTVFGSVDCQQIEASDAIFTDRVTSARLQSGCVRYSWVAPGSQTPRRFRCQPNLALRDVPAAEEAAVIARLRPAFVSESYGSPAYAQLAESCAAEISSGGDDGNEMGAWQFLRQSWRRSNLRALLPDYLPYGLRAGTFFIN